MFLFLLVTILPYIYGAGEHKHTQFKVDSDDKNDDPSINPFSIFAALIDDKSYKLFCQAAVISPIFLVSVVACAEKYPPSQIRIGVKNGTYMYETSVTSVHSHPLYDPRITANDISVIRISESLAQFPMISILPLPHAYDKEPVGQKSHILFFLEEKDHEVIIHERTLTFPREECWGRHDFLNICYSNSTMCGLSLGALLLGEDNKLYGISCFRVFAKNTCFGYFTSIAAVRDFIHDVTNV